MSAGEVVPPAATSSLYLGLGADTSDWLTQAGQYPAGVSSLPAGQASYYFADGTTAAATLDALHLYSDANRPALIYQAPFLHRDVERRGWHPMLSPYYDIPSGVLMLLYPFLGIPCVNDFNGVAAGAYLMEKQNDGTGQESYSSLGSGK